jgi:hypothetical protein
VRTARSIVLAVSLTACGADSRAGQVDDSTRASISIIVVLPADWPDPIYPDPPELLIEHGSQIRLPTTGRRTDVDLPTPGEYRIGAITGDGGCFDTAGVGLAGNPTLDVRDGDTIRLIDTGEVCD